VTISGEIIGNEDNAAIISAGAQVALGDQIL
jgi:hypothetical protein